MGRRGERGGTLALAACCLIVIVFIGVALYMLGMLFSGGREMANAADSGALNVAKQALRNPCIPLSMSKDFKKVMIGLTDPRGNGVDLLVFNRLVANAMLVSMNAAADGNPAGLDNASQLLQEIEGAGGVPGNPAGISVGAQLANALANPAAQGNWAEKAFMSTGLGNSLRMISDKNTMTWLVDEYKTGYLEQQLEDVGAADVKVDSLLANMPYTDAEVREQLKPPAHMSTSSGGGQYMRGYQAIMITSPNTSRALPPVYAVPTQPGQQPHLVSLAVFDRFSAAAGRVPGRSDRVVVPPNAFVMAAGAPMQRAAADAGAAYAAPAQMLTWRTAAIVGVPVPDVIPNSPGAPAVSYGYLVIDNSATAAFTSTLPNTDNVFANELGTGILVDRKKKYFAVTARSRGADYNAVESWEQKGPRGADFDPQKGPPVFDDDGNPILFDGTGKAVTSKQQAADNIPCIPSGQAGDGGSTLCTDRNSAAGGDVSDADCVSLAASGSGYLSGLSAFDSAYHPDTHATPPAGSSSQPLTASEQAKCQVVNAYGSYPHGGGPAVTYDRYHFGPTGLRLYPGGQLPDAATYTYSAPPPYSFAQAPVTPYSNPDVPCQITTNGTIAQLIQQTTGQYGYCRSDGTQPARTVASAADLRDASIPPLAEIKAFFGQRLREIKPQATDAEILSIWEKTPVPLGAKYYIYLAHPERADSSFVVSTVSPPWTAGMSPAAGLADGTIHQLKKTYDIAPTMINTPNDYGIHDHLFMTSTVQAAATDTVTYQGASGAYGLLGVIKFNEEVDGPGGVLNNRD